MRIQLASDLHLEFLAERFPDERLISPAHGADLLVLAGDIDVGTRAIRRFADWPVPVIYVAGNHEYYGRAWEEARATLCNEARGTNVVFLDNHVADLSGFGEWSARHRQELQEIRFLGLTMWTDYRLFPGFSQRRAMQAAETRLSDHFQIRSGETGFTAQQALGDHEDARAWLEAELTKPFAGKTVVVTHHAPHRLSIHPRFLAPDSLALNPAFASDLSELMPGVALWLHGHVHDSFDYRVAACRVVANPRGYPQNRQQASTFEELQYENSEFKPACLIDI